MMRQYTAWVILFAALCGSRAYEKRAVNIDALHNELSEVAVDISSSLASPADDRHPFWELDWNLLCSLRVPECAFALGLAGILCSAGGIGGGGVYVSVLMVVGGLTPRDAVPLSKAVVFMGSLSSLALNLGFSLAGKSGGGKPLIDCSICRLVVPAALLGTLIGVVVNRNAGDAVVVLLLSTVLLALTGTVMMTTYTQYIEEETEIAASLHSGSGADPESAFSRLPRQRNSDVGPERAPEESRQDPEDKVCSKYEIKLSDKYFSLAMLAVVVASGVVRHHASACLWELEHGGNQSSREASCQHPTLKAVVGNHLETLMKDPSGASWAMLLTLAVPLCVCSTVMVYNGWTCTTVEGWRWVQVAKYEVMGVLTGCLAGLIGIGGGLVFSPFFLVMGVEPAIAVATSSTCVIFTSSSTTLQYLFTDRIIMSLTLVYGIVNLIASYGGTAFVHLLQERFSKRRSYISGIVTLGVMLSAVLSLAKLSKHPEVFHF